MKNKSEFTPEQIFRQGILDSWPDAGMDEVVEYLRDATGLDVPPEWKEWMPTALS